MISCWSLSDSKSPQVSRSLLRILANLNNVLIWMISYCPLIFKSSSSFTNPFGIVPCAPITIGITVTFMFHIYLVLLQDRDIYLSFCFLLILLWGLPKWQSPLFSRFSFFKWQSLSLIDWLRLGDLFVSQNPIELNASYSPGQILGCACITCLYGQI